MVLGLSCPFRPTNLAPPDDTHGQGIWHIHNVIQLCLHFTLYVECHTKYNYTLYMYNIIQCTCIILYNVHV